MNNITDNKRLQTAILIVLIVLVIAVVWLVCEVLQMREELQNHEFWIKESLQNI